MRTLLLVALGVVAGLWLAGAFDVAGFWSPINWHNFASAGDRP